MQQKLYAIRGATNASSGNGKRINQLENGSLLFPNSHTSSKTGRIIWQHLNSEFYFLPVGESIKSGGLLSKVSNVYKFDMLPRTLEIDFAIGLTTFDSHEVSVTLSMTLSVPDVEEKIINIFTEEFNEATNEIDSLASTLHIYLQKFVGQKKAAEIKTNINSFTDFLREQKTVISNEASSSFQVDSIAIRHASLKNQKLDNVITSTVVEITEQKAFQEIAIERLQTVEKVGEVKRAELEQELQLTEMKNKNARKSKKKDIDLEIYHTKKKIKLLRNPTGILALHPKDYFELEKEKEKFKIVQENKTQETLVELLNVTVEQSADKAQNAILKKVTAKSSNLNFNDLTGEKNETNEK